MKLASLVATLAFTCSLASANTIVANGTPDLTQADARGIIIFRAADDFTLGSNATINSITFWMLAQPGQFSGSMTYAFYQNSAGALGSQIVSGTVNSITPTDLGQVPQFIYDYYRVTFNLLVPLQLSSGTYWLELHHGSSLTANQNTNVYWGIVPNVVGNALQSSVPTLPSGATGNELAFSLDGNLSGVPEPATISLALAGLGAICLLRRCRHS